MEFVLQGGNGIFPCILLSVCSYPDPENVDKKSCSPCSDQRPIRVVRYP